MLLPPPRKGLDLCFQALVTLAYRYSLVASPFSLPLPPSNRANHQFLIDVLVHFQRCRFNQDSVIRRLVQFGIVSRYCYETGPILERSASSGVLLATAVAQRQRLLRVTIIRHVVNQLGGLHWRFVTQKPQPPPTAAAVLDTRRTWNLRRDQADRSIDDFFRTVRLNPVCSPRAGELIGACPLA